MRPVALWLVVAAIGLSQIVDVNGKKEETFIVSFPKVRACVASEYFVVCKR